ncbi:MAG: hypothetical protein FD124_551 [Alphaproteobacteria bacterium]|nr:MAG: hypothetical protein FD160_419 [Caulobacteraceae bacterium]TPW08190.1 MAG: hypothetical protein FD124_551 [Alphaproteobacteria bacterium]
MIAADAIKRADAYAEPASIGRRGQVLEKSFVNQIFECRKERRVRRPLMRRLKASLFCAAREHAEYGGEQVVCGVNGPLSPADALVFQHCKQAEEIAPFRRRS